MTVCTQTNRREATDAFVTPCLTELQSSPLPSGETGSNIPSGRTGRCHPVALPHVTDRPQSEI